MVKIDFKIVVSVLSVVIIFLFLFFAGETIGIDPEVNSDLLQVLPGLSVIIGGFLILGTVRNPMFILPALGGIGIGFAFLIGQMNDTGMVVDNWVATYSLVGLQGFSIVFCLIIGAVLTRRAR